MPRQTILCVDDEKIILDSLKAQLKRNLGDTCNYEIAASAEEAYEVLDEITVDRVKIIILSDWLMPGTKGDEFLINVHKKYPEIVSIMLTGQADSSSIENAFKNAGLHKCFSKPWNENELIDTVKSILQCSCRDFAAEGKTL